MSESIITQDTQVKSDEERLFDWAIKVIEAHAKKMGASLEWKEQWSTVKGERVKIDALIIGYPDHPDLEFKELSIHQPVWFAQQLKAAERSLEEQRTKQAREGTGAPKDQKASVGDQQKG